MNDSFTTMWSDLAGVGRDARSGGYRRFAYTAEDSELREWFDQEAADRGLSRTQDRAGNLWAWWGDPDAAGPGVATGSHLDSVPDGGAFDGPLGVVSAFAAVDQLRAEGHQPSRPIGIACFADEEGARFGLACSGSRLLAGALNADRAAALTDIDGISYAEAWTAMGQPGQPDPDPEAVGRIGVYLELHVEQGRGLVELDRPVGVASGIWPHGRWRFDFTGRADHAGTTLMTDRADPMLSYAMTALAANKQARLRDARATFGRISVSPNGTNAIPSSVTAWLDARAADSSTLAELLEELGRQARDRAGRDGTELTVTEESNTGPVGFDPELTTRLAVILADAPVLPTAAGHDAGILALAGVPSAMLFIRNPTGISHSPDEHAEDADCRAGVGALADSLRELTTARDSEDR